MVSIERHLSGISLRKIAGFTDALSKVRIRKDAVSRIARRLEEQQKQWRGCSLEENEYPYLFLDPPTKGRMGSEGHEHGASGLRTAVCDDIDPCEE